MVDVAIVVDSASLDVREGETVNLKATVLDSDGNPVEGARIEWASENSEIAEVTADGTLTARQPGTVELTASTYGSSWDFRAWIRSLPRSIAIVAGNEQEGAPGETLPELLTVRLLDRKGRPTGGVPVTFSVTAGGGTAGPMSTVTDVEGRISAMWTLGESGEQRLEARVRQDHARVMKRSSVAFTAIAQEQQTEDPPVSLGQVTIDVPADTVLEIGASATLQATARDAVGSLIEDADIQWSSSNPDILTVDDMGRLVAKAAGAVLITAAAAGCASDTQRMVVEPPPVEAENPAAVTDLTVGDVSTSSVTLRWTAVSDGAGDVARYAIRYGSPTLSWGSAYETEVSVDADSAGQAVSYTYSGLADGTDYQFRLVSYRGTLNQGAVFGDYSNSVSAATEIEQGGEPDVASVTATPGSHTFTAVGQSLQIEATARDAGGTVVSGAGFTWASTNSSVVSVNSMGLVTARGAGSALVIVSAVCCNAADSVEVNVDIAPSTGDVLFADDFESQTLGSVPIGGIWTTPNHGNGEYVAVSDDISFDGSRSLKFHFSGTGSGGDGFAEMRFDFDANYKELWTEFYVYFPNGA
ncbi:MAG TPA: Ig-like domain-containing protein, partial [Longimicrobiales bacterium]|nr:Ig-like domain-containing protein [Longimicrobiales bacterium]